MRIAFDHQAFCRQPYGGVSRYFSHLAQQIAARAEHQVRIFAPCHINRHIANLPDGIVHGRYLPSYPFFSQPVVRQLNGIIATTRIESWHPDVVHETYFHGTGMAPRRTPVVVTVYDMIHERFPREFWPWDVTRRNKKRAVARADHVICISESTRRDLLEILDVPAEKVSVVYLAHEDFTMYERLNLSSRSLLDCPFILYVGHRGSYKNFARLLQAYGSSMEVNRHCKLVCFGGGQFLKHEEELLRKRLVRDRVLQLSGSDQLLMQLYGTSAALIYPSLYEGFGLPPLEAMANDCPVLCSNTSSLPEVVGDAALLFDPYDVDSIREALTSILFTQGCREQLIRKGRARLEHFSWAKCAEETVKIYESVC